MTKQILVIAVLLGVLSIVLGAFASHGLKASLDQEELDTFQIGVRYQMYHALFLLFIGLASFLEKRSKKIILLLTLLGVILFSGSLYGLATNSLTSFDFKAIGFITPIGGLLLILAWLMLLFRILNFRHD